MFLKKNIFIFFILISQFLCARAIPLQKDSVLPHDFYEIAYGTGMVNSRLTMAGGMINVGYGNVIVTARLCRSAGEEYRGYVFEDAFMMGYRFGHGKYFRATFSAGYSNLAFEKGLHTYFDATPDMFNKSKGFSLESELEYRIPFKEKISPFSISGTYYTTFNSIINLNGFTVMLKYCPDRRVRRLKK